MLYEPYTNSCGHTFCYSCLSQWFNNAEHKKSCPDCRAHVKNAPAPAYLVRDMCQRFISQSQLLPEGESIKQHDQWRQEEADIVDKDRNSPEGLFKGCFREKAARRPVVRDLEDGVDRCPECTWELEGDSVCQHCGYDIYDSETSQSDMDTDLSGELHAARDVAAGSGRWSENSDEDLDGDIDEEDAEFETGFARNHAALNDEFEAFSDEESVDHDMGHDDDHMAEDMAAALLRQRLMLQARGIRRGPRHAMPPRPFQFLGPTGGGRAMPGVPSNGSMVTISDDEDGESLESRESDEEDDEESDSQADSEMNDFLDDDEDGEDSDSDECNNTPRQSSPPPVRRARPIIVDSDDEGDPHGISDRPGEGPSRRTAFNQVPEHLARDMINDSESESDSDEGGGVSNGMRRR